MSFIISKASYSHLLSENASLNTYNLAFISDWSKVSEDVVYYAVKESNTHDLKGAFMVFSSQRMGIGHLSNVPFFQDIGLWIKEEHDSVYKTNSQIKNVIKAVSEFLVGHKWVNISIPYTITDMQEFIWNDLSVSPRYTYLLDITQSIEELKKNFGRGLKQSVKKLEKENFAYSGQLDKEAISLIEKSSLNGRSESEKVIFNRLISIIANMPEAKIVKVSDGKAISVAVFITCGTKAVYLFGGSKNASGSTVGSAVLFKGITELKNEGVEVLDFEGSMIPSVEKFFRRFGSRLVPLFNVQKLPRVLKAKELVSKLKKKPST